MDERKMKRDSNPEEKANLFSKLFFLWTGKIFWRGLQKTPMGIDELCLPLATDSSKILGDMLEENWLKELERAKLGERQPNLLNAVVKTFWLDYGVKLGILHATDELIFRIGQPLLLGILLSYFQINNTLTFDFVLQIAAYLTLILFLSTLTQNHVGLGCFHTGMKVRVACCSLIYRKALRLSQTALGKTSPGQVVNLLTNDVSRFDIVCYYMHYIWSAPLGGIFIIYFVWSQAGVSGLIGILSVFIFIPLQAYFGKLSSRFRLQTAYKTDERVRLMDEIISGIQVIKMYAWEKSFAKLVSSARIKELRVLRKSSYVRGVYMTFNLFNTRFAMFVTMLSLSLMGEPVSAEKVFVYATYFSLISFTMSGMFIRAFGEIAEALVSMKRLTTFLTLDEFTDHIQAQENNSDKVFDDEGGVDLKNVTARWNTENLEPTLNNISLRVNPVTLIAVVGPVGSGKSSLLNTLLGELQVGSGDIKVNGRISYASQEPWVFAASVRQNITFGSPFNQDRYAEVVRVCALNRDFKQWPQGDQTIVGERGSSLSGGQRARINLARAVYKDADIYLLDDPLSAVDTHVGKHLFDECINRFLADKTRILVTHQLQYLEAVENIVLFINGGIQIQGTFKELMQSDSDFAHLLAKAESKGKEGGGGDEIEEPMDPNESLPPEMLFRQIKGEESCEKTDMPVEEVKKPSGSVLFKYFNSGVNVFVLCFLIMFFILAQTTASLCDYWVSVWAAQDVLKNGTTGENAIINFWEVIPNNNDTVILSTDLCLYVHSTLIIGLFIVAMSRSLLFCIICTRCSLKLHDNMFSSLCQTLLSFFHNNPSGRILNRFSKDLGCIDEMLPKALLDAAQIFFSGWYQINLPILLVPLLCNREIIRNTTKVRSYLSWFNVLGSYSGNNKHIYLQALKTRIVIGSIILTITVNYIFLIPVSVITVIALIVRMVFLRSSKNIKRIEGITRSPVFTHLNATLQGLTTIRAYSAEKTLKDEFDNHQDLHSSAWHLYITTSTAFGFTLDMLCFILITSVCFTLLLLETGLNGGQVGLAITQTMALNGIVQFGMRRSAEVSNQLTSVERVLEYSDLKSEPNLEKGPLEKENAKCLDNWPNIGKMEFKSLSLFYKMGSPPAIRDFNLVIQAGEKIGIIGRTGAGKSSIVAALFRLARLEGNIVIDGIETAQVSLRRLRSKISIIPQEPVLFSGTIRRNLDPFQMYKDVDLWLALEEVKLKDALPFGLESPVLEGGSNFSVGQKQLLCLARAILRNNKILLLDEATANIDPQTDALIQYTIRRKFQYCTVCTIAHRLNTIMDSDKVLVMNYGKIVEFDTPYNLLQIRNGFFTKMLLQTGATMAEQLRKIAEENRKE